jgi:putative ABC transport system substrate-binding protein
MDRRPKSTYRCRWSASDAKLARIYSAELIGLMPDVILAATTLNLTMIHQATGTVPVVFVAVADPVKQGFVASIRQPGGNLTGFSLFEFSLGSKWIDLLKDVVPGLRRVAVMFNPDAPQAKFFMPVIEAEAPSLDVQVIPMPVRAVADIEPALASFAGQPNNGLILLPDIFLNLHISLIADLMGRYRLPAVGSIPNFARYGGLMAYGNTVKLADQFRQAATYVDRILKGSKPSDLPVQGADRYGLVINLKTAKALGLTVPLAVSGQADEVIE